MSISHQSKIDQWTKCISTGGTVRAIAVQATETAQLFSRRHQLNEGGARALAEGIVAGLILSSYCKSGEKVNLNVKGSGWCEQAIIDANADAEVRGYIRARNPGDIHLAKDVGPWGIGLLSVLRTKFNESQPYIGTVPLITGHLAKDLTFYWLQSEQVHSAVGIEVFIDEQGQVALAEGFLIQALPGANDGDLAFIENHIKSLPTFGKQKSPRSSPFSLISSILDKESFSVLEQKPISAVCNCSEDRVKRSLTLIGNQELQSIVDEKKDVEINCDFCSEHYRFSIDQIRELMI